jgi:hypothetical protein
LKLKDLTSIAANISDSDVDTCKPTLLENAATFATPDVHTVHGVSNARPQDDDENSVETKPHQVILAPLSYSAAVSKTKPATTSSSVHAFACTESFAQPQQDRSMKTEKRKGKKVKNPKKPSGNQPGLDETKVVNSQGTGTLSAFIPATIDGLAGAFGDVNNATARERKSNDNSEVAAKVTHANPTKQRAHASTPSMTSSSAASDCVSSSHLRQPSVTSPKNRQNKIPDPIQRKIVPPALPLPIPHGKRQATFPASSSSHSSESRIPLTAPDVESTADVGSDTSSPMSTKTAKEFQTPAPSPLPGSSSPTAANSTQHNNIEEAGSSTSVSADIGAGKDAPGSGHLAKSKKKNKNMKSRQTIMSENTASKIDGNTTSSEAVHNSGESKDKYDESITSKPREHRINEEKFPASGGDEKQFRLTQDAVLHKEVLQENSCASSDSWAHVVSKNQSANTEPVKQQGLKNRSPNLPGTVT